MKTHIRIISSLLLVLCSGPVMAQVEVTARAEVEIIETGAQGEQIVRREPATSVVPGTEVIYTITAKNTGTETAGHVVVTNPVPAQTVYVEGSATGAGTVITFSVDGGSTYDAPARLTVPDTDGKPRPAVADDYTHVRWSFTADLAPDQRTPVAYRARVK